MMLGWISDPFVCVSVLLSALFSIWATFTALASFFATGGCVKYKQYSEVRHQHFLIEKRRISYEQRIFQREALCSNVN